MFRYIWVLLVERKKEHFSLTEMHEMLKKFEPTRFITENEVRKYLNVMFLENLLCEVSFADDDNEYYGISGSMAQFR